MVMFKKPGIKRGIVTDSQLSLSAKSGYILVLDKVLRIVFASTFPPTGDHCLGQAVYSNGLAVVGLLRVVVSVKLILDMELSYAIFPPSTNMQSRKAEHRISVRNQAIGFHIKYGKVCRHC